MGESCLVRSFSQPSQERTEGDPLRALTTSVSFGRFMSESLDWEKWSSFTHNRYLEEVEKYAKPGSVAEKKAYFEAQHKKAVARKAALLLEKQNAVVNESSDLNVPNQNNDQSTLNSELTGTSSYVGNEETQREERELNVTTQIIDDSRKESEFTENGSSGDTEEAQPEQGHLNVTPPDLDHCPVHFEFPGNSSHMGIEEMQVNEGDNKTTCGSYPIPEEINLGTAETENSLEQSYPVENEVMSLNHPENVVVEVNEKIAQLKKEKTQTKNAAMAGDSVLSMKKKSKKPLTLKTRLTNKNESSKFKSRVKPVAALQPTVTDKSAPTSRKKGKVLIEKKQSNSKSRHMSIKFFSHRDETKKTLSPILEKIVNSRLVRSITKTSGDSKVQQTSTLASISGISKHPSETPERENRRDITKLDQSLCRSRKEEGKSLPHSGNLKSINKHGNIACSPTVFSPFSLRSEERAAKRREFFQKLEQKQNTEKAEKEQRRAKPKENTTSSSKVLISRARPNPSICHERESSSNHMKKGKATSGSKVLSRAKPNPSINQEGESSSDQMKKEKASSSSKVLTSRAKPNSSIHQERELSSNLMKKEKATSSSTKVITSRAKPNAHIHQSSAESNASVHRKRESSSNQMKKMPRQPFLSKFSGKPELEVQDNNSRQPWRLLSGKSEGSKDVKSEKDLSNHFPVKSRSDSPMSLICESVRENASPNIQV